MKILTMVLLILSFMPSLAFAIDIPRYGEDNDNGIGSSNNSGNYQSNSTYTPLETVSDRDDRHEAEEYQARQDNPTQIDPHRNSPLGDETTQEDLNRFGK